MMEKCKKCDGEGYLRNEEVKDGEFGYGYDGIHPLCPVCEGAGKIITHKSKARAILDAIRKTEVGSDIIIHNEDMSIWCILTKKCEEHPEKK